MYLIKHESGHRCLHSHFIDVHVRIGVKRENASWHVIFYVAVPWVESPATVILPVWFSVLIIDSWLWLNPKCTLAIPQWEPSSSEPLLYNILLRLPLCASMLAVTPSGPVQELLTPTSLLDDSCGGCEFVVFQTGSALRWWKKLISLAPPACNNQLQVTASDLEMYWICVHTMEGFELHIPRVMHWKTLNTLSWKQTKYGSGDAFFSLGGLISPRNTHLHLNPSPAL